MISRNDITFLSVLGSSSERHHGSSVPYSLMYDNFMEWLKKINLDNFHQLQELEGHGTFPYGSEEFNNLTKAGFRYIHEELNKDKTVLFIDLDVVVLKDPIDYLLPLLETVDIAVQNDCGASCTGFFIVKPTPLTKEFFDPTYFVDPDKGPMPWLDEKGNPSLHDQNIFNLRKREEYFKDLKIMHLPDALFPNGDVWYNRQKYEAKNDWKVEDPYIVHYNWANGIGSKINKMKDYDHWLIKGV